MAEYAPPIDPKEGVIEYAQFMGLRNNVGQEAFGPEDLSVALNVDIDDALGIGRRKGYSAPVTANVDRDLWASGSVCLGVGSNALKLVNPDYSTATLRTGLTPARPLAYAAVADRVYYANGSELGCVQNGAHRTWGITPPGLPVATACSGSMQAGKYQYAATYLRSDGQESGTGRAGVIELTDTGGISLATIPVSTDATVTHKVIYCTTVDGKTLYRAGVIANATTTFVIDEVRAGASPLLTQFLSPPPAGDHLAYINGRMLVAHDNRLYVSEPYAPELFDLRKSYPFLDAITMVAVDESGVWIGTGSQILWLAGSDPEKWEYKPKAEYGVIPGALYYADGEVLGDGHSAGDIIAFFATKQGLCAGLSGGKLLNLTAARFAYPSMDKGAGIVRRHRGINQFLVSLQGTETAGNVFA